MCCLGCAIFGITEVPTDGVDFDTGELSDSGTCESPMHAAASATTGTAAYVPPPPEAAPAEAPQTSTPDVEQGQTASESTSTTIPKPAQPQPEPAQPPAADLLDIDIEQGRASENQDSAMQTSLHELD